MPPIGNVSSFSSTLSVTIDTAAPTVSAAATTGPNANGWYNSNVSVAFTALDSLSGVTTPVSQLLTAEGTAVSSTAVTVRLAQGEEIGIRVMPSTHAKCVRCWHHREDVGKNTQHPELCGRCVQNVEGPGEARAYA